MNLDERLNKAKEVHLKGVAFFKNRDLQNAHICFKEAIELVPELTVSQMMITIVYLELGDISKAKYHARISLQHREQLKPAEIVQLESVINLNL